MKTANVDPRRAEGQIDLTMGLKWLLPPAGESISSTGGIDINATASVQDMVIDGLPYDTVVTDGVMDIIYLNRKLSISGRGAFNDAPGFISLDRYADRSVEVDLALSRSEALTAYINDKTGLDLGGSSGGVVTIRGGGAMRALQLDTRLDLDETSINIRRFGVVKLPARRPLSTPVSAFVTASSKRLPASILRAMS